MTTRPARKDRLGELRKEIAAKFGTGADVMPRVAAYGKDRQYPAYQVYTIAECEKALADGVLPDPATIAAMTPRGGSSPVIYSSELKTTPFISTRLCIHGRSERDCSICLIEKAKTETPTEFLTTTDTNLRAQNDTVETEGKTGTLSETTTEPIGDEAQQIAALMASLARKNPGAMDEGRVRAIIAEMVEEGLIQNQGKETLSITVNDLPAVEIDGQHETFPLLLAVTAARVPCMMVGPAGSGKTSAAHAAANALKLAFYCMSVGPQTSKSDFKGFRDANGNYHRTPLRDAYEHGGVFLLDEIDAGNPGVITELNACLANDGYTFADGVHVTRHADFISVAAANTFGTGADRQYVGRNQLDAATLDRFFVLEWGYDEAFEASLIGIKKARTYQKPQDSGMSGEEWYTFVTGVRGAIAEKKIRHIVSPRATIYGAKLLRVMPRAKLEEGLVWKGLKEESKQQVKNGMRGL